MFLILGTLLTLPREEEPAGSLSIRLWREETGAVETLPLEQYLVGVVAAEMPASFEPEALASQAVAARTYAARKMQALGGSGCSQNPGADVCDTTHCQCYIDRSKRAENWGERAAVLEEKVADAVVRTTGQVLIFDNKLIDALYHAASGGMTETAADYFGTDYPYLKSVESAGENCPKYENKETAVELMVFLQKLKSAEASFTLSEGSLSSQTELLSLTEGGRVESLRIGNTTFSGRQLREVFGLPSAAFSLRFENSQAIFVTRGHGHGVGMSQYGANAMALAGKTAEEILTHYYTGVEIKTMILA